MGGVNLTVFTRYGEPGSKCIVGNLLLCSWWLKDSIVQTHSWTPEVNARLIKVSMDSNGYVKCFCCVDTNVVDEGES